MIGSSTASYRFNETFIHNHCGSIKIFDLTNYEGTESTIPHIIKIDGKLIYEINCVRNIENNIIDKFLIHQSTGIFPRRILGKRLNSRFGSSLHIPSATKNVQNSLLVGSPRHSKTNKLGMGEGTVYSFSDFPLGIPSDNCGQAGEAPCPEESANLICVPDDGDERSLFGFSIISTESYIFVSAPKSSTYARQSGVIYVYER